MQIERLSLRLRVFLFFALLGLGGAAMIAGAGWVAASRIGPEAAPHLVLTLGGAGFGLLLLTAWIWQLFDENVARPILLLSGELEAKAQSGGKGTIETAPARYLGALAPAAEKLAGALATARGEAGEAVTSAIGDVLAEKAQLEAVLRDLRECVLICNVKHEILLYNSEAQRLLGLGGEVGLGRPLFRLITEQPIRHALQRLQNRVRSGRYKTHRDYLSVAVVCATRDGSRTLQGRISLILAADGETIEGFVATFHDATILISDHAARDHLLKEMLEGLRRPSANLRAAAELLSGGGMDAETHERFIGVIGQEVATLSRRIEDLAEGYGELRVGSWSMNDVSTAALAACVADRLSGGEAPELSRAGPDAWLHCDSFTVVELLGLLCRRLATEHGAREIRMSAAPGGAHIYLDLDWDGDPLPEALAEGWLSAPLVPSIAGLTGRDVLLHHRTEIWSESLGEGRARLRLPLPTAVEDHEAQPASVLPQRPEFYDFALLAREVTDDMRSARLRDLRYVVFDTETTGLFPSAGDEIVQIGAVRVLSGRMIRGEVFDRLVDPGRHIPAASTRVHGITDDMVAGQGTAQEILPLFHDFCADHVLVAHNAPFDLKFLQLKEGLIGRGFDMPVLDTVLLSAHLFGHGSDHRLDALATRFGASFEDGTRHTALADALATAEVFCAMIGALEDRGVGTLAEALAVSEEAGAIRRKQARH